MKCAASVISSCRSDGGSAAAATAAVGDKAAQPAVVEPAAPAPEEAPAAAHAAVVPEYSVKLQESGSDGVGLDVELHSDGLGLLIKSIKPGVVQEWNRRPRCPHPVRPGDVIVEVNGIRGDPARMVAECQDFQVLAMTLRREPLLEDPAGSPDDVLALPRVSQVRVALLGGENFLNGVGKADVASALLCGITSDWPGGADPVYEFAYDFGVFERAWAELSYDFVPTGERWGVGPLTAWYPDKVHFCPAGASKKTPAYDADASKACASLCAGSPENLGFGHAKEFRNFLVGVGHDVAAFEAFHKELYAAAEANPNVLVRKNRPCPGVLASLARYSPDVGLPGCGAAIVDIFEPGWHPCGCDQNIAVLYAAAPNSRVHKGLTPGTFLYALQATGTNIGRLMRECNWHADGELQENCKRSDWWRTDLRCYVEYTLSEWELKNNHILRQTTEGNSGRWLPIDVALGFPKCAAAGIVKDDLLAVLRTSRFLETHVTKDGRTFVRHRRHKDLPGPPAVLPPTVTTEKPGVKRVPPPVEAKRVAPPPGAPGVKASPLESAAKRPHINLAEATPQASPQMDNRCWDFYNGYCNKGAACRWSHLIVPGDIRGAPKPISVAGKGGGGGYGRQYMSTRDAVATVFAPPTLTSTTGASPAPFAAPKPKCMPRPA
eukprot:TRINITY_DN20674_c0_g1_i1.p1 TRINITY_DN20674_c0_g1~~TRINITY_DN20674_c0_g1_i1.p1  ORF type:complete len:769 (+),score=134.06 TRINITY_DN20674_c0_g1_i1:324-2309(+)